MVHWLTPGPRVKVSGRDSHGGTQSLCVFDDGQTAIVIDVRPFVRIGRPRIRHFESTPQVLIFQRDTNPKTECAVHVDPGSLIMRPRADGGCRIKGSRIYIACLNANNGVCGKLWQLLYANSSLLINLNRDHALTAQPKHV